MQKVVVADQNGRGNAGKKNCRSEELVFLESTMKGSRRTRLQMQSIRHPKISLQFSYHWFLQNSLIFLFSLKNMTCNMQATKLPAFQPATLLLFSMTYSWHRTQKWFTHFKQVHSVLLKQEKHKSSCSSCHFVSKDQNKVWAHCKNRKSEELGVMFAQWFMHFKQVDFVLSKQEEHN